jgi:peptide-N4-(N-acetyl-beta-glucosaminyl)asparagine amidase
MTVTGVHRKVTQPLMTRVVEYLLGDSLRTVTVPQDITLIDFFQTFVLPYHQLNPADYLLFDGGPRPFDNARLTSAKPIIISRADYSAISSFATLHLPSLVDDVCRIPADGLSLIRQLHSVHRSTEQYANADVQAVCYSHIPIEILERFEGEAKICELARWFKEDFFTFIREPACRICGAPTRDLGLGDVTRSEQAGLADRVFLYKCDACGAITRFPRYRSVPRLLEMRKGRCGEWAICFGALLATLEFDTRLVYDSTDHIWAEFWSEEKGRYVHVDPCENIVDRPLVYEEGWGKQLEWIVAIGVNQCVDVTKKYTRKWSEVVERRSRKVDEEWLQATIGGLNAEFMAELAEDVRDETETRQAQDESTFEDLGRPVAPEEQRARASGAQ